MQTTKAQARITIPLEIEKIRVLEMMMTIDGAYVITVESTEEETKCRVCGKKINGSHGVAEKWITLRHLSIMGRPVYLRLRPKRYKCNCSHKPTTSQRLEWYEPRSPHTKAYDEHLMKQLVNSTIEDVSQKEGVKYDAVVGALERQIQVSVDWEELEELGVVGIDEVALRKGRKNYAAIISTQQADGQVKILAVLPHLS